jgi:hypothetical protein
MIELQIVTALSSLSAVFKFGIQGHWHDVFRCLGHLKYVKNKDLAPGY